MSVLGLSCVSAKSSELIAPVELRVEDLRHHIHVESAVEAGARNAVKLLQSSRTPDKKALAEVPSARLCFYKAVPEVYLWSSES